MLSNSNGSFTGKVAFVTGAASGIGLHINAVCPGYIDTPMMGRFTDGTDQGRSQVIAEEPIGRMGKPEEIAAAVVWLCSDAAAFMVRHTMGIDGGQTVQQWSPTRSPLNRMTKNIVILHHR